MDDPRGAMLLQLLHFLQLLQLLLRLLSNSSVQNWPNSPLAAAGHHSTPAAKYSMVELSHLTVANWETLERRLVYIGLSKYNHVCFLSREYVTRFAHITW